MNDAQELHNNTVDGLQFLLSLPSSKIRPYGRDTKCIASFLQKTIFIFSNN